eukprot:TRINITY_DN2755_c0_g1_i1.p1 TRINITY_DN2755_c0_g1~~TRINITY_DN2755_c0_g1_i1.p1  ORF type:complete len:748 (+),score=221.89 TRINITY_DN2755_c0_g1_i1:136-2379(+)
MSSKAPPHTASRLKRLGTETAYAVSAQANAARAAGKTVYSFHIGDLNFRTPNAIIEATKKAIDEGKTGYVPADGILPLKEAIAANASRERGVKFTKDEVIVQPGGKPIIAKFLLTLMEEGDEVLYPSPGYPIYESLINFYGGVPKPYYYKETDGQFGPDFDQINSLITPKTKIFIWNDFHNPTGALATKAQREQIAEICIRHNLWVLSDEAYFHLVFGKPHGESIVSLPGMKERTVILFTCSKSWAMTGWRIGCAIGPKEVIALFAKLATNDEACTTNFIQWGAIAAFEERCHDFIEHLKKTLTERRDVLVRRVNQVPGFSCKTPPSAFYLYVNATKAFEYLNTSDYETFRKLIFEETGVAFCTREHFGASLPFETEKYVRFAYSGIDVPLINEAFDKLQGFMEKKHNAWKNRKLPKVFCTRRMPQIALDSLRTVVDLEVWEDEEAPPRDVLLKKVKDVDGLVSLLTDKIDQELLDHAPKLKIVTQMAVGFNNIDVKACTKRGVYVTNTPGVLTDTVVESTFALLFAASRRIVEADNYLRRGDWKVSWHPLMLLGHDLHEKTLGIIGFGRIGKKVAIIAQTFGAKVVYYDVYRDEQFEKEHNVRSVSIEQLLRESDFVSIHTDLNPSTHKLINEERLKIMKPNAILINTARGPIVDQAALYKALKEKRIFAAALDVFEKEPIDMNDPLLKLDNVVLLPHLGSASLKTREAMAMITYRAQKAFWSGQEVPCLLNPDVKTQTSQPRASL